MSYIQNKVKYNKTSYKSERDVMQFLCCVLGNGINLDLKGKIESYLDAEFIITEDVQPLIYIYPLSSTPNNKYHLRLAGCSNKGWKEAVQYLIDCILITPDTVKNIKEWKDNIHYLEELRDYPTIVDKYATKESAEETFVAELEASPQTTAERCNHKHSSESVYKVHFFDVQWSDCPVFVYEEVKQIWSDYDLGNDDYMYKTSLNDELFESYPRVYMWLKHKGVLEGEQVIVHWWW